MQGYQGRHLGRAMPEGVGPCQGHRSCQTVACHSGRAVEHLHRVLHPIRRAARYPGTGRREATEGSLPRGQQRMGVGAVLAAGGRRPARWRDWLPEMPAHRSSRSRRHRCARRQMAGAPRLS
eukprot:10199149-Alexandrium_andersonii.AAC.1